MPDEFKPWLLFKHPVFKEDRNVTFRLGDKWAARLGAEQVVEIREYLQGGAAYLFDAFITDTHYMKICDIPQDLLEDAADPACRTQEGVLQKLRQVYPRANINGRTGITVIAFEQCDPDPGEHDDPIEQPKVH